MVDFPYINKDDLFGFIQNRTKRQTFDLFMVIFFYSFVTYVIPIKQTIHF
jgi:hypothetical protein